MEDPEGGLSFDFEGGLFENPAPSSLQPLTPTMNHNSTEPPLIGGRAARSSFRQTVCRHWLRGLCMKGDACGFLHQYDKSRMPVCRFFRMYGACREQDCVYKHTTSNEGVNPVKECNMYKLGFCPNGPDCRYRHAKLPGPPPPVEEVFQKIQHLTPSSFSGPNKFFQHRNTGYSQQAEIFQVAQGSSMVDQGLKPSTIAEFPYIQHPQVQNQQPIEQQVNQTQSQNLPDGWGNKIASPLPQGLSRYFVVKSCKCKNLNYQHNKEYGQLKGAMRLKLNEAFDSVENVILIFSVHRTRHFQVAVTGNMHMVLHIMDGISDN